MKRSALNLASLALVLILLLGLLPGSAFAVDVTDSGSCGEGITWSLDSTGTLTISGTGAMENYVSADDQPWAALRSSILHSIINEGVTEIGDCAFSSCENMTSVSLPNTLQRIGWVAFECCFALTEVIIPASVNSIADNAFIYCNSLKRFVVSKDNPTYTDGNCDMLFTHDASVLIAYPAAHSYTRVGLP